MPITFNDGSLAAGSVGKHALNTTAPGQAVITKIVAGTGITIGYTGVDAGTGEVTINVDIGATAGGGTSSGGGSSSGSGGGTSNVGTVTSVNMVVPMGFELVGAPITSAGTMVLRMASGYSIPTNTKMATWDTAYSWGNHASAGYLTSESDTLNTVTTRGAVTTNIIRIGGIYASSDQLTYLGSEINYFYTNRIGSSGTQGFKIKGFGNDLSFWRYNDGTGDVEIGNVTSYGLKLYTNNNVVITFFTNGDATLGTTVYNNHKFDVAGTVRSSGNGYYGSNGTITAQLIKFSSSNEVYIDGNGFGAQVGGFLKVGGYTYATGRFTTDSYVISKGGSQTPGTTFVSYGIGRPDTTLQVTPLGGIGGVYEGTNWFNGLALSFFVSSAADISGGNNRVEKMRLKSGGDLLVSNLAGTGTRMVVADSSGILSTQSIPSGGSLAIGSSITSATAGSILFAGTSGVLSQNNSGLFWNDASSRLGIGTNAPTTIFHISTTGTNHVGLLQGVEPYVTIEALGGSNSASLFLKASTNVNATIQSRGSNGGIEFYVNGGATLAATFKSTGRINFSSLPTSSSGLSAGDLWNDAGTVKIV